MARSAIPTLWAIRLRSEEMRPDLTEAATTLAALGFSDEAAELANSDSWPHVSVQPPFSGRMGLARAAILGRVAVAQSSSGIDAQQRLLDSALRLARASREPTHYGYGVVAVRDIHFERVLCDLAQDFIVIGQLAAAREIIDTVNDPSPQFPAACRGKLASVLYQLSKQDEASAMLQDAQSRALILRNESDRVLALGGISDALYQADNFEEALKYITGTGITRYSSDNPGAGGIRLTFYGDLAEHEFISGRYANAWRVLEVARNDDNGFPYWVGVVELLSAMTTGGLPTTSRTILARIQALVETTDPEKVPPNTRAALGAALWVQGDHQHAESQLNAVAQGAGKQTDELMRIFWLQSLARGYADSGNCNVHWTS